MFFRDILADVHEVVRVHAHDVRVIGRVMDLAEAERKAQPSSKVVAVVASDACVPLA
jgi:hypothetical protein